jgi:2-polyprenyl-3-methyl-5-hydroxy-6-metoxy-1,4-benzoquinol methylase
MDEIKQLSEEIFCLKYELNTLAGVLLRNESERWVPGYLYQQTEHSHTERYKLACSFSAGKKVIDVACGSGKGSYMLSAQGKADSVKGFDIQPEAVRYASWRNADSNVTFEVKDAQELGITNTYDLAVSFETVEHLPDCRAFLKSVVACLKPDGRFIISTPISAVELDTKPANPYHVQEWGFKKFQEVLKEFFDIEKVYVQLYPKRAAQSVEVNRGLIQQGLKKIKRKLLGNNALTEQEILVQPEGNLSKIEEFAGQYNIAEFGDTRIGYQIVLLKMKGV